MKTKKVRFRESALIHNSRWAAYASAGAAAAIAGVQSAEADIHYSGPVNQHLQGGPGTFQIGYFQLTAPNESFGLIHVATDAGNEGIARFVIGGHGTFVTAGFAGFTSGPYAYVSKLLGGNINAAAFIQSTSHYFGTMAFRGGSINSQWLDAGSGFVAFKFDVGAGTQFGWVRVTMDGQPQNSFTVVDYAWGDAGDLIAAGQIPEPGSLGLLALGGAGLLAWRKRRAKAPAA